MFGFCFSLGLFLALGGASAGIPQSQIKSSARHLTPVERDAELHVEVYEDGVPVDLSGSQIVWRNPSNKLEFSDQEGDHVIVSVPAVDGIALELAKVEASVWLPGASESLELHLYVKIRRPWGSIPEREVMPAPPPRASPGKPETRDSWQEWDEWCYSYPSMAYLVEEVWYDWPGNAYHPTEAEKLFDFPLAVGAKLSPAQKGGSGLLALTTHNFDVNDPLYPFWEMETNYSAAESPCRYGVMPTMDFMWPLRWIECSDHEVWQTVEYFVVQMWYVEAETEYEWKGRSFHELDPDIFSVQLRFNQYNGTHPSTTPDPTCHPDDTRTIWG